MALGFGLIGCGGMGRELAQVLRDHVAEAEMAAAFDPYGPNLEKASQELGVSPAASLEELLDRGDVEAVIIASPNHLHCEQTVAAAEAGKRVFCEKPMALSAAECDRMMEACERAGVKLMVGQCLRLVPMARRLREVVAAGELGEPRFGLATFFHRRFRPRPSGSWHMERRYCGGLIFHCAIHEIDLFHALFGPTRRVQYAGARYGEQVRDFDDVGTLVMEFESGATGVISTSSISAVECRDLRLICSGGFARWDTPWTYLEYGSDLEHLTKVEAKELAGPDMYEAELRSFARWILHDETPVLTAAEGRAAVAVAEAAQKAEQTGRPIAVGAD